MIAFNASGLILAFFSINKVCSTHFFQTLPTKLLMKLVNYSASYTEEKYIQQFFLLFYKKRFFYSVQVLTDLKRLRIQIKDTASLRVVSFISKIIACNEKVLSTFLPNDMALSLNMSAMRSDLDWKLEGKMVFKQFSTEVLDS